MAATSVRIGTPKSSAFSFSPPPPPLVLLSPPPKEEEEEEEEEDDDDEVAAASVSVVAVLRLQRFGGSKCATASTAPLFLLLLLFGIHPFRSLAERPTIEEEEEEEDASIFRFDARARRESASQ